MVTTLRVETHADLCVGDRPLADLVREYHRPMIGFARSLVNSASAAEEVVQETWVQVIKSAAGFEGRSREATWLFGILRHTALHHRRKEARIREHEELARELADPLEGRMYPEGHPHAGHWATPPMYRLLPEDNVVEQEMVEEVRAALTKLPARQRQLVILRDFVGLTALEAEDVMGITGPAQRALLYRARGNLRTALERRFQR